MKNNSLWSDALYRLTRNKHVKKIAMIRLLFCSSKKETKIANMERTKPNKKFLGKTFLNNLDAFSRSRVLFMTGAMHKVKKTI